MLPLPYTYPHHEVVVLKSRPGVVKLDPAPLFKYLTADGGVQLVQVQVEIPAVLGRLRAGRRENDGLPTVEANGGNSHKSRVTFSHSLLQK